MLCHPPTRAQATIETEEPNRAKFLREQLEPSETASRALRVPVRRTVDLKDSPEPSVTKSTADTMEPILAMLRRLHEEPKFEKLRIDIIS